MMSARFFASLAWVVLFLTSLPASASEGHAIDDCFLDGVSGKEVTQIGTDEAGNLLVVPTYPYNGGFKAKPRKRGDLFQCMGEYKDLKIGTVVSAKMGDGSYVNREIWMIFEDGRVKMDGVTGFIPESQLGREVSDFNGIPLGAEFCVVANDYGKPTIRKLYVRKIFSNGAVSLGQNGLMGAFAEYQGGAHAHRYVAAKDLKTCDQITLPSGDDWDQSGKVANQSVKSARSSGAVEQNSISFEAGASSAR